MTNSNRLESPKKTKRNQNLIDEHGALSGKKVECND